MKKQFYPVIIILFCLLCLNLFAGAPYAFEYTKSGTGNSTIIFIPGFACSGDVWKETRQSFNNDHTCYTLTMAGFAGVTPQDASSFSAWTESIAKFIKDENIKQPIIIGHSMGGALAMAIAAKYPGLTGRIVIVDALPCLAAMMNPEFKSKQNPDCSEMIKQMTSASDEAFYSMQKKTIAGMLADTARHEAVIGWSVRSDRRTCASMYCDFSNTDLREPIKNINCPTLVLLESYFVNFKPAIEAQYANLKSAELKYADKGLHFIMYDDPKWFVDQLHDFIN